MQTHEGAAPRITGERPDVDTAPWPNDTVSVPARPDALRLAALGYAARGWPVFPCEPGCKAPLGALVPHGFRDATTDPEVISAWWSRCPDANVAIATGAPAVDVLDVDVKPGGSGFAALDRAKAAGLLVGACALVSTPSGGAHVYFKGTTRGCGALSRHFLDFKASGGYVLAPPSVIDERDPKARRDPGRRGRYELVQHRDITPRDLDWSAVKRLLAPPARASAPRRVPPPTGGLPRWLTDRLADLSVADRSAHFHGTVGACWRAGLSQEQAVDLLTPWCEAVGKYPGRVAAEVARSWAKIQEGAA
ncbi:bifunctional DNA primase/polymerase [Allonocardiopsis opalescens]|uniref:Bifunctional DNA primase/polymerase-like protein n=1 Tax=Allonocardiopsis opalescens TaxID=1144618 RepID=A0A2T0Q9X8_9ACTN|nr:bifunctional DNA primase/polymerase [Allonocardiopsis opalescens]PRY00699.1 bifunctional DNA primase/polymerase-like protein [Allonocardiopsis opalescens]